MVHILCSFHRVNEIIMNGATVFAFILTTFDILNFTLFQRSFCAFHFNTSINFDKTFICIRPFTPIST